MFLFAAFSMSMVMMPYQRLTGFWENGLRWRRAEAGINKWDNTSIFEKNTLFKRFKVGSE